MCVRAGEGHRGKSLTLTVGEAIGGHLGGDGRAGVALSGEWLVLLLRGLCLLVGVEARTRMSRANTRRHSLLCAQSVLLTMLVPVLYS